MSKQRRSGRAGARPLPALSRGQIDILIAELVAFEAKVEAKRAELLRHYREGARKGDSWLLRGHEYDVLLTRAGVVNVRDQASVQKLPMRWRNLYFQMVYGAREWVKDAMRGKGPGGRLLITRVRKLLKLSRHWRVKPERRKAS